MMPLTNQRPGLGPGTNQRPALPHTCVRVERDNEGRPGVHRRTMKPFKADKYRVMNTFYGGINTKK